MANDFDGKAVILIADTHSLASTDVDTGYYGQCRFDSFHTARRILKGYEAMAMIRKRQIQSVDRGM
ncbi:hypothetical protein [Oscillatoria sp. CS-180]|uniref:hypothetical protein n=1 Tax=Oscillatoria sp. CS-180 TaxID=3021720 RepID=UPI003FA70491